ncbi:MULTISPECIES: hypothetical protein [unclassified Streptomyces]|uniref:hypothetical protein n=1 Tax=unclassified Streptomyces TaxID=2593676 RepID=UPI00117DCA57|nr:hypothetical protein [Streptomyces sp. 1-11]
MEKEVTKLAGSIRLVRIVPAAMGEAVAGISAAALVDAVLFATSGDLQLSGRTGRIQCGVVLALALLWTVNLLVSRPRERRAHAAAVPVENPQALREQVVLQRRLMRRGQIRSAALVTVFSVVVYLIHLPIAALGMPAMLLISLLHVWRISVWERSKGLTLWKPAPSEAGREEWRNSPYYSTPVA